MAIYMRTYTNMSNKIKKNQQSYLKSMKFPSLLLCYTHMLCSISVSINFLYSHFCLSFHFLASLALSVVPLPLYLLLVSTYCLFTGSSHPVAYFWGLRAYRGGLRIFLSITQSHDFILNSTTVPCVLFKSQAIMRLQGPLLGQRCTFAY
jgi:hypothetical protein